MLRPSLSLLLFSATFFLFLMQESFANIDHRSEEKQIKAPAGSMYTVKEDTPLSDSDGNLDNIFSPTDLFMQDELVDLMPMGDKKMEGSHNEHADSKIKLSHHEKVSSSSKGFGTAIGITLFAGLVFAGLTIRRPGE